jgi:hypothetical protein
MPGGQAIGGPLQRGTIFLSFLDGDRDGQRRNKNSEMAHASADVGGLLSAYTLSAYGLYTTVFLSALEELLSDSGTDEETTQPIGDSPRATRAAFA